LPITGDYVDDDFRFITRDLRHEKFRNQANSFENFDFLKDF